MQPAQVRPVLWLMVPGTAPEPMRQPVVEAAQPHATQATQVVQQPSAHMVYGAVRWDLATRAAAPQLGQVGC